MYCFLQLWEVIISLYQPPHKYKEHDLRVLDGLQFLYSVVFINVMDSNLCIVSYLNATKISDSFSKFLLGSKAEDVHDMWTFELVTFFIGNKPVRLKNSFSLDAILSKCYILLKWESRNWSSSGWITEIFSCSGGWAVHLHSTSHPTHRPINSNLWSAECFILQETQH